jgi:hypothetical protein
MGVFVIKYFLSWDEGYANFDLEFDEETISLLNQPPEVIPDWAKLRYCQCPNCTLDVNEVEYCPTAVSLIPVVESFRNVESDSEVEVEARVGERKVALRASARRAISSVVGLRNGVRLDILIFLIGDKSAHISLEYHMLC